LTYALVEEGLKTTAADNEPKDGVVNAREWLDYATERVPQMQEEKMKQTRGLGLGIAFTEGEQKIAIPKSAACNGQEFSIAARWKRIRWWWRNRLHQINNDSACGKICPTFPPSDTIRRL
jgi:hypothetical protein